MRPMTMGTESAKVRRGLIAAVADADDVSLVRALRTDDVVAKAIADAHTTALVEAMTSLSLMWY